MMPATDVLQSRSHSRFRGRSVLVIGGSSGIGLACAVQFAREGGQVGVTGRDPGHLKQAAEVLGSENFAMRADVSNRRDRTAIVEVMAARHGRIDVLVGTVGIQVRKSFVDTTEADWDLLMETNLKGLYFSVQAALPLMREGSSVVFTTSLVTERPRDGHSIYAATKAGLSSLTKTLGGELISRGVRVNEVRPGPIDTPMIENNGLTGDAMAAFRDNVARSIPMRRWGRAAEVANAVLFLASDEASFITGSTLAVDGGSSTLW